MPSFRWICPALSQQVMKGLHCPPGPQSAFVLQRTPQPQRQNPDAVFPSSVAACGSSGRESVLCNERSGCSTVLMTGLDAAPSCPLGAEDELAKALMARTATTATIRRRNLVSIAILLSKR